MNRFETMALGLAGGVLVATWFGGWKVIAVAVLVAGGSYAIRRWVGPWLAKVSA